MKKVDLNYVLNQTSFAFGHFSIVLGEKGSPADFIIHDANLRFKEITGYDIEDIKGKKVSEIFPGILPDEHDWSSYFSYTALTGNPGTVEKYSHYFGKWFRVEIVCPEKGEFITLFSDITDRVEQEKDYARLFMVVRQAYESIVMTDLEANIEYVNPAFEKVTGYKKEEMIGRNAGILKSGLQSDQVYKDMWNTLNRDMVWHGELKNKRKDGGIYLEEVRISPVFGTKGKKISYIAVKCDVTELRKVQEELEKSEQRFKELSMMDYLTSLYNRRHIFERIEELIERRNRFNETFAIAIIDLDHFKKINDKYGYKAGDKVLRSVARLLKSQVRKYDVVGRYDGEEFIILFPEINRKEALHVMERIKGFTEDMKVVYDKNEMYVTFSCGIADIEEVKKPRKHVDMIVEKADRRLYKAKENGRNRIVI